VSHSQCKSGPSAANSLLGHYFIPNSTMDHEYSRDGIQLIQTNKSQSRVNLPTRQEGYQDQENGHLLRGLSHKFQSASSSSKTHVGNRVNSLLYRTRFPVFATTAGGQNPTLYLNALKSKGASLFALVYTVAKPLGFCW
jgi:hypothetical protein